MKADIRRYTADDWPRLRDFLREHWSPDHPILHRPLFDWQYRGFREAGDRACDPPALLLFDHDQLVAFLGLIFGDYQINKPHPDIVPGYAIAMWLVHPAYRQAGLGLLLLRDAEKRGDVATCLGANPEAGRYYKRRGYACCPALSRWVAPLKADGYTALCAASARPNEIAAWSRLMTRAASLAPEGMTACDLATHWQQCTQTPDGWAVQGLQRSRRFWQTRYLDAVGFQYRFWGDPHTGPVLVGRIEPVHERDTAVFRLIELLPTAAEGWYTQRDDALLYWIRGALAWAAAQGCVAADYQVAGNLLQDTLTAVGFRRQAQPITADAVTSLAPVFQPLHLSKSPINVYWKAPGAGDATPWYFPKSDGDMDRPHAIATDHHCHVPLCATR